MSTLDGTLAESRAVLEFWLQDALTLGWPRAPEAIKRWFSGGAKLDAEIAQRFGALTDEAVAGGLSHWEPHPLDRLALVIVLDQFTRNIHRGTAQAFAGDARTQPLVLHALGRGWDRQMPLAGRLFFYLPLGHAETLALQQECVRRMRGLLADAGPENSKDVQASVDSAEEHRDIVARFGRFPHRNAALGRTSTGDERQFLQDGPRFGQ